MDEIVDGFESKIPLESLKVLLLLGPKYGFDPTASSESEEYFVKLTKEVVREGPDLQARLEEQIAREFRCMMGMPRWIQNPEWQFAGGRPMIFVGQMEVQASLGYFHDDAVFYVFWDAETGGTRVTIQVA